jgi:transposase
MNNQRALKKRQRSKYMTTNDSPDVRNTVGAIYNSMRAHGLKRSKSAKILSDAGFDYPERTLRQYASQIKGGESPVPSPGTAGRNRALTHGEEELFCGWVLAENEKNNSVSLKSSQAFLDERLGVQVTQGTVHKLLHQLGFSSKVMQTSSKGYKLDKDQLLNIATNWLNERTTEGFFDIHPSELGSIDFTFTSQRTYRPRSYTRRGG